MRYILFFLIILGSSFAYGQDSLQVQTVTKTISKGSQPGLSVDLPLTTSKKAMNGWKRQLKRNKGEDLGKGKESRFRVFIPEVSKDTLWVYALTEETNEKAILTAFLSLNDSNFFNTGESAESFSRFMRNYAVDTYRESVRDLLNDERSSLKKMEDELEGLNQQSDKWHKQINENNREMERTRDQINMDKKEQDMKNDAIYKQKQVLATYQTPSEQKEIEEKKLKELEKEKKRFVSKIESANKKIDDLENENRQLDRKITKNTDENIPDKRNEIIKQKEKIKGIEERLSRVH